MGSKKTPAWITAAMALTIISSWQEGNPISCGQMTCSEKLKFLSSLTAIDPDEIILLWPEALNAAKFIARTTNLPIPEGAHS